MDSLRRATSKSPWSPPISRAGTDGDDGAGRTYKATASDPLARESERSSQSGFHSYSRPMRRGTVLTKSPRGSEQMSTLSHGGARMNEADGTGIIAIGMALGSPTVDHDVLATSWQPQVVTTVSASKEADIEEQPPKDGLTRSKSRKWGLFGRSKSKRIKESERGPAQLPSPNTPATRTGFQGTTLGSPRDASSPPLKKPLGRSFTEPTTQKPQQSPQANSPRDTSWASGRGARLQRGSSEASTKKPLLDVEIPDITLERYSVMFAGLLERRSAASLLARRQNTHDRLRALKQATSNDTSQKDMYSSGRKNSADRDLPPIPPLRLEPLHASSRARSNTSPAVLTPQKDQFMDAEQPRPNNEHSSSPHIVRLASVREPNRNAPVEIQGSDNGRRQLRSKFHIQSPTQESAASQSTFGIADITDEEAGQGDLSPPPLRRNNKGTPADTEDISSSRNQRLGSRDYTHTVDAPTTFELSHHSLSEEEPDEEEAKAVLHAVEISIARQISVSREQRRMLGPLQMNPIEGRRLVESKSSTPRLVDPKTDPSSPPASYRKSERVVLEGV